MVNFWYTLATWFVQACDYCHDKFITAVQKRIKRNNKALEKLEKVRIMLENDNDKMQDILDRNDAVL